MMTEHHRKEEFLFLKLLLKYVVNASLLISFTFFSISLSWKAIPDRTTVKIAKILLDVNSNC